MDIYIINLDKRQDRLREISSHLGGLGLDYIRVAAIDALTLTENQYSVVDKATDACWRSHQLVFALISQGLANNAVVLEDDAALNSDINWGALLNQLDDYMTRSSIDILQLGFVERFFAMRMQEMTVKFFSAIRSALKLLYAIVFREDEAISDYRWGCLNEVPMNLKVVPNDFAGGAHCYIISHRAASAFQNLNAPIFLPVEEFFYSIAISSVCYQSFKIARTSKSLAAQTGRSRGKVLDSDIESYIASFSVPSKRFKQK